MKHLAPKFQFLLSLSLFLLVSGTLGWAQAERLDAPLTSTPSNGNLAEILQLISSSSTVPISAELVDPLMKVDVPARATWSARSLLNQLISQVPQYRWRMSDGVIHFYNESLYRSKGNFFNLRIAHFTIQGNVADVLLLLRSDIGKELQGIKGAGGLVVGIRPSDLANETVPTVALSNVTVRQIIAKLLSVDPKLFSVVIYPTATAATKADTDAAFEHWYVRKIAH